MKTIKILKQLEQGKQHKHAFKNVTGHCIYVSIMVGLLLYTVLNSPAS